MPRFRESPERLGRLRVVPFALCLKTGLGRVQPTGRQNSQVYAAPSWRLRPAGPCHQNHDGHPAETTAPLTTHCLSPPNPAVNCWRGRRRSHESPTHLGRQCVVRCDHYGFGPVQPTVRRNLQVSSAPWESPATEHALSPLLQKQDIARRERPGSSVIGPMGFPAITPHPRQFPVTARRRTPGRAVMPDVRRRGSDAEVVAQEGAADPDGLGCR